MSLGQKIVSLMFQSKPRKCIPGKLPFFTSDSAFQDILTDIELTLDQWGETKSTKNHNSNHNTNKIEN